MRFCCLEIMHQDRNGMQVLVVNGFNGINVD